MSAVALLLFIAGAALPIFGFKKSNRALLTMAAFVWLAFRARSDDARGFSKGWNRAAQSAQVSSASRQRWRKLL